MSEAGPDHPVTEPVRTGVADVDEVLTSVESLDEVEVAAHPAVFEAAHERLRSALDGAD